MEVRFCPRCGSQRSPEARFCGACGFTYGGLEEVVAERVACLADDARIRAYEILGDRPRAVGIMESRLRA